METKEMYSLYCEGYSLEKVGLVCGLTRQSIYARFKRKGYELRSLKKKPFIIFDGLKFTINKDGYYECTTVDRLMLHNYNWELENGKIPKGYELHHIDLNKINNDVSNLQMVTPKEHTTIHSKIIKGSGMNVRVRCEETGVVYNSIIELARELGHHASNISRYYIDGKRKLNGLTYEKIN